jgi:FKBP-type peptidyl-prolyl cis-trans isomerase
MNFFSIKTRLLIIAVFFCSLLLQSQTEPKINYRFKSTKEGLKYKKFTRSKGLNVLKSQRVYIHFTTWYKSDSTNLKLLVSNEKKDFLVGHEEVLLGWDLALPLLKVGDSALVVIPSSLAYGDKKIGSIPKNATFYLWLKVIKTEDVFFNHSNIDTTFFKSGLKKIIVKRGNGNKVVANNEIKLNFTGYVYSEKGYRQIFEKTNFNEFMFSLQVGVGKFVKGLDEGIAGMEIGEKATFIVPPHLGYGNKQFGKILPNTTLYFDIELIDAFNPFFDISNVKKQQIQDSLFIYIHSRSKKSSNLINKSDIVTFDYKAYFMRKDSVKVLFENSLFHKTPMLQRPGSGNGFPGVENALINLRLGDSATLFIPNKKIYNKNKLTFLPKGADIYFDLYILNVNEYPFLKINSTDTIIKISGLKYIEYNKSPEIVFKDSVKNGTTLNVSYTIYYNDSLGKKNILDCSRDKGKTLKVTVGDGKNIKGFEEGLLGMHSGLVRKLIIPPALAYGEDGLRDRGVPKNSNLIMDIEYIELIK